jgi:hypothetical protein
MRLSDASWRSAKLPVELWDFLQGLTLSGRPITLPGFDPQNPARLPLSEVYYQLKRLTLSEDGECDLFLRVLFTARVLQRERTNSVHFEDLRPGFTTETGQPVPEIDRFSCGDVLSYGMSGGDGRKGFCEDAKLPSETSYLVLCLAAGLALLDEAVAEFDAGRGIFGSRLAAEAIGWVSEAQRAIDQPALEKAAKFAPKGRGKGPMYRLLERVMVKQLVDASARDLWRACAASPTARRMGFEFGEEDAWLKGHGNVSFSTFKNTVTAVRKVKRGQR